MVHETLRGKKSDRLPNVIDPKRGTVDPTQGPQICRRTLSQNRGVPIGNHPRDASLIANAIGGRRVIARPDLVHGRDVHQVAGVVQKNMVLLIRSTGFANDLIRIVDGERHTLSAAQCADVGDLDLCESRTSKTEYEKRRKLPHPHRRWL